MKITKALSENPRITQQEKGLIKGALRRVFSRSELRRKVVEASVMRGHVDRTRPRVKTWCKCAICGKPEAKTNMQVDHRDPIVPLDKDTTDLYLDELVNALWCEIKNLDSVCKICHASKTKKENAIRRSLKKEGRR